MFRQTIQIIGKFKKKTLYSIPENQKMIFKTKSQKVENVGCFVALNGKWTLHKTVQNCIAFYICRKMI